MGLADKINNIVTAKENLRLKLNSTGLIISKSVPFSSYPTYITNLAPNVNDDISSIIDGTVRHITIPNTVKNIQSRFKCCKELQTLIIPEGVESIADGAFYKCNNLTSITLPSTLQSFTSGAFGSCYHLSEVINLSNLNITTNSFNNLKGYSGNTGIDDIYTDNSTSKITKDGNFVLYNGAMLAYYPGDNELFPTTITVPNNITSLHNWAFAGYDKLEKIILNENISEIPMNAITECNSLLEIVIPYQGVCSIAYIASKLLPIYMNNGNHKIKIRVPSDRIDAYNNGNYYYIFNSSTYKNYVELLAIEE